MEIHKKLLLKRVRMGVVGKASILAAAMFAGSASAAGITIDGVLDGDMYANQTQVDFFNDHWSQFAPDAGNPTTIHWTKTSDTSLNVFASVPLALKNMIWGDGVSDEELALYNQAYSTHHDDLQNDSPGDKDYFDYEKATGSEKFVLGATSVSDMKESKTVGDTTWAKYDVSGGVTVDFKQYDPDEDGSDPNTRTSIDWVVKNVGDTPGKCTTGSTGSCDETGIEMSFEKLFTDSGTISTIVAWLEDWDDFNAGVPNASRPLGLVAHLSPERGGELEIPPVPLPAAFWLFGTALIGFIGISRRTSLG